MSGIFIAGPSGTGKTTFCKIMSANYGFHHIINVMTGMTEKHPEIKELDFYSRQLIFIVEFVKIHTITTSFLSDRSILDVLAWTDVSPKLATYLGLFGTPPELTFVIPTPPWSWYKYHSERFLWETRFRYYKDKLGIPEEKEIRGDDALSIMYDTERTHHKFILETLRELNWNYHILKPSLRPEEFVPSWQKEAEKKVFETWNVPRFTLDAVDIDDEEREKVRTFLIDKRDNPKVIEEPTENGFGTNVEGDVDDSDSIR